MVGAVSLRLYLICRYSAWLCRWGWHHHGEAWSAGVHGGRMLITRERTSPMTNREISDWIAMSPLTRWVSGMVSVGLNAITFVNATYRWSWNRGCQFACPSPSVRVCGNWKSGKRYLRPDGAVGWVLLAVSVVEHTDCGDYSRQWVTYASEPGARVPAYLLLPRGADAYVCGAVGLLLWRRRRRRRPPRRPAW